MTANINQYRQWIDQLLAEGQTVQVPEVIAKKPGIL